MALLIRVSFLSLLGLSVVLPGCAKKTKTEAKPAKDDKNPVKHEHAKGPHGGHLFDVGPGHKIMGELVFTKDGKLELYLVDHHDVKKAVMSGSKAITITAIKHDGKALPDLTLDMRPLETDKGGSSRFVADKLPKEIADDEALHGAKFKVLIDGKEVEATIEGDHKD